jgi:DNA-binding transcriptional LysR family regulator
VTGGIKIATIYSIGLHELPSYIKEYMKLYPLVKIHVDYRRSNQVYDDIIQGTADFGLLAFPEKKSNLEIIPFRKDKLVLICHPRHKLSHFKAMSVHQIQGHPFVGFDPDMPTRKALDKMFRKHKLEIKPVMEFDNIETLKRAVEIDMGISMVPISTVMQEIQKETLKTIEFTDMEIFRPLSIVYRKNRVLAPALKAFLALLEKELSGENPAAASPEIKDPMVAPLAAPPPAP